VNYRIFEQECEADHPTASVKEGQKYMEDIFKKVFQSESEDGDNRINVMLNAKFCSCSFVEKTLEIEFPVQEWELNPVLTMHGGLMATTIDMTCGLLVRFMKRSNEAATVHLSVDYLRSVQPDEDFIVSAKVNKFGRNIIFLTAEVKIKHTHQIAATASLIFV